MEVLKRLRAPSICIFVTTVRLSLSPHAEARYTTHQGFTGNELESSGVIIKYQGLVGSDLRPSAVIYVKTTTPLQVRHT